jgi:hypothetical protein
MIDKTINAQLEDANLIIMRERYTFAFWMILTFGVGAFTIYKVSSSNK